MRKFTAAQQLSIGTTDRNLLVSAGAGAGKTATLVERIFQLLVARPHRCSLDELLVVTFSRAAAQEMRSRLVERIHHAMGEMGNDQNMRDHLARQLLILPRAAISTIHSFCLSVITSHPDKAGLAPGFDLMSEEEERLFRADFLQEKIEDALASKEGGARIRSLIANFDALSGVERLLQHIVSFHGFLSSLPSPEKFCGNVMRMMTPTAEGNPPPEAMALVEDYLLRRLRALESLLAPALRHDSGRLHPSLQEQYAHIRSLHLRVQDALRSGAPGRQLDQLVQAMPFPRQKPVKNGTEEDENFKALRGKLKDDCDGICEVLQGFLPASLREDFFSSRTTTDYFVKELGLQWHRDLFARHVQERRLTFAHLERLAQTILVDDNLQPTPVALAYQRAFRHVLVDEFQDVNELQNIILRSVSRQADGDRGGNLFAVGDVKQSIYEFRQADSSLFLSRYEASAPMKAGIAAGADARINLRENFRSHPALLNELNGIFRLLFTKESVGLDYDDDQAFVSGRPDTARPRAARFAFELLPSSPVINGEPWDDDISAEAVHVADLIAGIGPPWKDVCILLRSTVGSVGDLMEALRRRGIPYYSDARAGFLTAVEVIEFQSILKAINNPFDEIALLGMLRGPAERWNEEELLLLRVVDRSAFFIDNLERIARDASHSLSAKANHALADLQRWQDLSTRLPMHELFTRIFDDLHLLDQACVRPGGDQRRLNLLQMLEHARQFDSFLRKGLGEFLKFLDDLIANDEDFSPPSPLAPAADVVRIMSIHKSKGMQFPIVVYPFLGRRFNEMDQRQPFLFDRHVGAATHLRDAPSELKSKPPLFEVLRSQRKRQQRAEELRLLYVAMTRAEEALHIIGSVDDPVETVSDLRAALAEGTAANPADVQKPIDWLLPFAIQRFAGMELKGGRWFAADGIASFVASNDFAPGAAGEKGALERSSPELAPYAEAWSRIVALEGKEVRETLRAKISVTEAKRAFDATRDGETPAYRPRRAKQAGNAIDWFPLKDGGVSKEHAGLSRGKATHRFLATCDLVGLATGQRRLAQELSRLIEEGYLSEEDRESVNLQDIAWFLNSELGKKITRTLGRNLREKAFTCRIDASELNAPASAGFVILQGVLDLIFRDEHGWILVDYKTDFCGANGERIAQLRETYTPQLQLYRVLVERTLKEPVAETWIAFLQGRQFFPVPAQDVQGIAWTDVVESGAVVFPEVSGKQIKIRGV